MGAILMIAGLLGTIFLISTYQNTMKQTKLDLQQKSSWIENTKGLIHKGGLGSCLAGFDTSKQENWAIWYFATDEKFVFYSYGLFQKLYEMPRNCIRDYEILDNSQFLTKYSYNALAVAIAGPFGIEEPKTELDKRYYLRMNCVREDGTDHKIMFLSHETDEFVHLVSLMKPFQERLKLEERKCPFCAEVVKMEAIKCRFCGSELKADEEH